MEIKITKKSEMALLERTEVHAEIVFKGAVPSRDEVGKKIAAHEGANQSLAVVQNIHTMHGFGKASVLIYIYKNEDAMKKIEYNYMVNRGKPKKEGEQKAAEAAPAQ